MSSTGPNVSIPADLATILLDIARAHERHQFTAFDDPQVYARSLFHSVKDLWVDAPNDCDRDPIALIEDALSELESASESNPRTDCCCGETEQAWRLCPVHGPDDQDDDTLTPCDWCGRRFADEHLQNETQAGDAICDHCAGKGPRPAAPPE
jgi:hypothetical protein